MAVLSFFPAMHKTWVPSLGQEDPGEENGCPLLYFCLENFNGQEAGYRPCGCKELNMNEWLTHNIPPFKCSGILCEIIFQQNRWSFELDIEEMLQSFLEREGWNDKCKVLEEGRQFVLARWRSWITKYKNVNLFVRGSEVKKQLELWC